jgi:hypothetical protein
MLVHDGLFTRLVPNAEHAHGVVLELHRVMSGISGHGIGVVLGRGLPTSTPESKDNTADQREGRVAHGSLRLQWAAKVRLEVSPVQRGRADPRLADLRSRG